MTLLAVMLSYSLTGCTAPQLYSATDAKVSSAAKDSYKDPISAMGDLPASRVLDLLAAKKLVVDYPTKPQALAIRLEQGATCWDAITDIERAYNWVYDCDRKVFLEAYATHSVDSPDEAGRSSGINPLTLNARAMVAYRIRFVNVTGSLSGLGVNNGEAYFGGGAQYIELGATIPAGVNASWSSTTERSFFNGLTDTQTGETIQTERSTVQSGVTYSGIAGLIPGSKMRLHGALEVSSFTGESGLDRSVIAIPVQVDGPRREWVKVFEYQSLDANAKLAFRNLGLSLGAGASAVAVYVRLD